MDDAVVALGGVILGSALTFWSSERERKAAQHRERIQRWSTVRERLIALSREIRELDLRLIHEPTSASDFTLQQNLNGCFVEFAMLANTVPDEAVRALVLEYIKHMKFLEPDEDEKQMEERLNNRFLVAYGIITVISVKIEREPETWQSWKQTLVKVLSFRRRKNQVS